MDIFEKVLYTVQKFELIQTNDKILIGVSGGPDSVTLLNILNNLKDRYQLSLKVAHVDHMLREEDSVKDMQFVQNFCEKLNVQFCFKRVNIKEIVKDEKISLEKAARDARYDFFNEIAFKEGFNKIATGHNADDQVETILMHMIRGAAIEGLIGIPPVRKLQDDIFLIRPLIEISAKEIRDSLSRNGISYRIDSTNKEQIYFRNKIRHGLLPEIEKYNSNFRELLLGMSENLKVIEDYIKKQGRRRYRSVCSKKNHKIFIDLRRLKKYHPAIQRQVFRNAVKDLNGNLKKITYQHWKEFELLLKERPAGSIVDLPYKAAVKKTTERLIFYNK